MRPGELTARQQYASQQPTSGLCLIARLTAQGSRLIASCGNMQLLLVAAWASVPPAAEHIVLDIQT